MPYAWLQALEQPESDQLFMERTHIESLGYVWSDLPNAPPMPIGFAKDIQSDKNLSFTKLRWKAGQGENEPWVGLTCAACHTAQLTHQGKTILVDGGPTYADFQTFLEELNAAIKNTADDDAKFARFAQRVFGGNASAGDVTLLRAALNQLSSWQQQAAALNNPPSDSPQQCDNPAKYAPNPCGLRYGYGRLDAFGHIYNKVAKLAGGAQAVGNPSDAPVSYPFLWNVPQLDKVQWNSIADNKPIKLPNGTEFQLSALGRNTGEVIGVFADVQIAPSAPIKGYVSSVDVKNLDSIEVQLRTLKAPLWPVTFDKPDPALVSEGRDLFKTKCESCHAPLERDDLTKKIKVTNVRIVSVGGEAEVGTDPWMACNAYAYQAKTGLLQNTPEKYYMGDKMGASAPLSDMLGASVAGTLVGKAKEVAAAGVRGFFGVVRPPQVAFNLQIPPNAFRTRGKEAQLIRCRADADDVEILGYQSRPLTGIWATAPYLHNGSVPTLYDLLLPPDQRPKVFYTGSREFDPEKVGLAQPEDTARWFKFETENSDGTPKDGNWNLGHDYGNAALTEQQRNALVAYMKTL